jgi:hypothetical protein
MSTRTYRALLIANSTFPNDAQNLPDLEGPRNDPALLRDALCDGASGLFPSDNIRMVTERTMAEVLRETEEFLTSASRQDTLLLYYSGHGMLDQRGELFLCTRDSRSDRLRSTAVKASDLRGMLDESAALTTVILLDCCHSGRFKGGIVPGTLAGRGRFVVTSSRGGELANDAHVRNRASLFTYHLTEGLVRGAEDHDGDGVVNLSELYDYVHAALIAEGRQVPQKRFEGDGDVPVALRAVAPDHPQVDLVAPATVPPILDLSDTVVDLGDVEADEVLPPERIAVINRGGGTLEWTVESSAGWVEAVAEATGVVLHLRPPPGPNRANVYVRDRLTGELKTIRVSVRVRPAPLPATAPVASDPPAEAIPAAAVAVAAEPRTLPEPVAVPEPAPLPEPVALPEPVVLPEPVALPEPEALPEPQALPEPLAPPALAVEEPVVVAAVPIDEPPGVVEPSRPPSARRSPGAPLLTLVAGALAVLGGVLVAVSGFEASAAMGDSNGVAGLVRREYGPGLLAVILGGLLLALVGLATLVRFRRGRFLGLLAAVALPTGLERLAEDSSTHGCSCLTAESVSFFPEAGVLCLVAGLVAAVALVARRPWTAVPWIRTRLLVVAIVAAAAWGVSTFADVYTYYGTSYGSYTAFGGTAAHAAAVIAVVGLVALTRWLTAAVGREVLLGAAALPVFVAISELVYFGRYVGSDGIEPWGVLYIAVPAAVLFVAAVVAWRSTGKRQRTLTVGLAI